MHLSYFMYCIIWCTDKFSETPLVMAYGREIKFMGNSSGGHSCSQHAKLHAPSKLATSVALCCVIKLHIFEWPLNCDQPKAHLYYNHGVWSASWYATPVRWMNYLGKGEVQVLDLWVQLMKNGGKNRSVAFIILFSVCFFYYTLV